jgi:hypothetical protein
LVQGCPWENKFIFYHCKSEYNWGVFQIGPAGAPAKHEIYPLDFSKNRLFVNLNYRESYKIINTLARLCDPAGKLHLI